MRQEIFNVKGLEHGGVPLASKVGPIVATSVIMGHDPATRIMPPDANTQARNAFNNLRLALEQAGCDLGDVVKVTMYVKEEADRPAVVANWEATWPDVKHRPARRMLAYPEMRHDWRVQIEALAVAKDAR